MTSDDFGSFFIYLPTYPKQIIYYMSLFSKIRRSLTYLPTQKSDVIYGWSQTVTVNVIVFGLDLFTLTSLRQTKPDETKATFFYLNFFKTWMFLVFQQSS